MSRTGGETTGEGRAHAPGGSWRRFFLARAVVGALIVLQLLVQGRSPGALSNAWIVPGLLAWIGIGSTAATVRPLLRRWPRATLGILLALDTVAAAAVIGASGGVGQPTLLWITLPILAGGLLLQWRAGLLLGLEAALLFEVLVLYQGGTLIGFGGLWPGIAYHTTVFVAIGLGAGVLGVRAAAQQREATAARRELERVQLSTDRIVESLGCGLIALDDAGQVRTVNRAARRMLRVAPVGGAHLGRLLGRRNGALVRILRTELRRRDEPREHEARLTGAEGGRFPALVRTAPLLDADGRCRGLVALIWDLTERKLQEEARRRRERLAAIGELAAGLAHEIRNSLKPITGCIELIEKRGRLDESARPMLDVITRESDALEAFLSQFLTLARDKTLKLEPVDLEDLIGNEVSALLAVDERRRERLRIKRGVPVSLRGDRKWLRQILRNLILNGLEASPHGRVTVEHERFQRRGAPWVRLRVSDEGPGFGRLDFSEALKPFRTGKAAGTGLGLSTAMRGIQEHGGRLALDPRGGEGTTVIVELPLAGPPAMSGEDLAA